MLFVIVKKIEKLYLSQIICLNAFKYSNFITLIITLIFYLLTLILYLLIF